MMKPVIKVDVAGPKESEKESRSLIQLTEDVINLQSSIDRHSEKRPTLTADDKGYMMFDETLGKPIWWNGEAWVDAIGNPVDVVSQEMEQ